MEKEELTKAVRERYGNIAKQASAGCCPPSKKLIQISSSYDANLDAAKNISKKIGYSDEDMDQVPEGANLGLGCGNPVALASLKEGEVVLDLGSGAGFDCFLASSRVGKTGKVIGIDMTPEMLDSARENAAKGQYPNVEFRLGEIENLPVADNSVDAIISNCVINLSRDKQRVFNEAFRVLKPGGRLMVSDMVILKELPAFIKESIDAYVSCVAGAMKKTDYLKAIKKAGFESVKVVDESVYPIESMMDDPSSQAVIKELNITPEQVKNFSSSIASVRVQGLKPAA
jgi:arsenite methyltransferase